MDRPSAIQPRPRWWHRWACVEVDTPACHARVVSWHATEAGADNATMDCLTDFLADPMRPTLDTRQFITRRRKAPGMDMVLAWGLPSASLLPEHAS